MELSAGDGTVMVTAPKVKSSTTVTIATWFLLVAVVFFPLIRVGALPIPVILIFAVIVLAGAPIVVQSKKVVILSVLGAVYLLTVALLNSQINPTYSLKDIFYFFIPLQFLGGYILFSTIFTGQAVARRIFVQFCIFFLAFEGGMAVIELAHVTPLINLMHPYLEWFITNTSNTDDQLSFIMFRPSGTLGSPVILGTLGYIVARFVSYERKQPIWVVVGILLALVSASRMALIASAASELTLAIVFFQPIKRIQKRSWIIGLVGVGALVIGFWAMFTFIPFMSEYVSIFTSGKLSKLSGDYSFSYRSEIFAWSFQKPLNLIFGGISLEQFPAYVDCEALMRSLQFGVIGYVMLQLPVWCIVLVSFRNRSNQFRRFAVGLIFFLLIDSFTFYPFTNPYFIIWYSLIGAFIASQPMVPAKALNSEGVSS